VYVYTRQIPKASGPFVVSDVGFAYKKASTYIGLAKPCTPRGTNGEENQQPGKQTVQIHFYGID
jgi:hypothetical protein